MVACGYLRVPTPHSLHGLCAGPVVGVAFVHWPHAAGSGMPKIPPV